MDAHMEDMQTEDRTPANTNTNVADTEMLANLNEIKSQA